MWRLFDAGAQDAGTAIGRMPALAQAVLTGAHEGILLTSVWGRAHLNVGWFEDVDVVVDLDEARSACVDVVRRPVIGGGTAFYDSGCAATAAFFLPEGELDEILERYEGLLHRSLDELGLHDAAFESGDIRWRGRKLGALISQNVLGAKVAGCFLNLRRPDLDLYKRVARVPDEKFADKTVKDMIEYVATPQDVRGSDMSYEEFRDAIVDAFDVDLSPEGASAEEDANAQSFAELVSSREWVTRVSSSRFTATAPPSTCVGFANHKGRKLVRAGVAVDGAGVLRAVMLAGDMHLSPPEVIDDLARSLVGCMPDETGPRVEAALSAPGVEQADVHLGVTTADFVAALEGAVRGAT